LTIGSGGSGGVFGPSVLIGGCLGAGVGKNLHWVLAVGGSHPPADALGRLAGLFAGGGPPPAFANNPGPGNDRRLSVAATGHVGVNTVLFVVAALEALSNAGSHAFGLTCPPRRFYYRCA